MRDAIKPDWNIDETKKRHWAKMRHPFNGGFELTQKCNFRCKHCYLQNSGYKEYLTTAQIKLILDKLAQKGILFLYFTGGEVFTRTDFEEIWLYAKKLGFILEILTNASLIDEDILRLFDTYPPAEISISVYGASEESYRAVTGVCGQYEKVMRALHALARHGLNFSVKFIGMQCNMADFTAVENLAQSLGVPFSHSLELFPAFDGGSDLKQALSAEEVVAFEREYEPSRRVWQANAGGENFYETAKRAGKEFAPLFACECGTTTCIVDAQGYLLPCNKLRVKRFNLLTDAFDTAWDAYAAIKKIPAPSGYPCLTCANLSVCNPCPAQNFLATGDYALPDREECRLAALRNRTFCGGNTR